MERLVGQAPVHIPCRRLSFSGDSLPWPTVALFLRELDSAALDYGSAIVYAPKKLRNYVRRAIVSIQIRDYKKTVEDLNTAIKLDSQDGYIHELRATAYLALNDSKAIRDADAAIELERQTPPLSSSGRWLSSRARIGQREHAT